jgi:hypothetical protein
MTSSAERLQVDLSFDDVELIRVSRSLNVNNPVVRSSVQNWIELCVTRIPRSPVCLPVPPSRRSCHFTGSY